LAIRGWLKSRELPLWSLKPEYEFSSEESEGEENNREVEHDPTDSSSQEGRVKSEGASRGYEFSSEESEGEENNREVKDDFTRPSGSFPNSLFTPRSLSC
jgi:hypothetical protein